MDWMARIKVVLKYVLRAMGMTGVVSSMHSRLSYWLHPPSFRQPEAHLPRQINFAVSFTCLAACPHCYFIQEDVHVFRGKKFMDDEFINSIFQSPGTADVQVACFVGGEALLHPMLFDWLGQAARRGIRWRQVVTNGVPLQNDDTVRDLIEKQGYTNLQISLDADNAEDYMAAKGIRKVDYNKILDSISSISAAFKNNEVLAKIISGNRRK